MKWKYVFYVTAASVMFLVLSRAAIHHFDPITAIDIGMSTGQVTHIMGSPQKMTQKAALILYSYPKARVAFQSGKVVVIATDVK
jgi:hypothetical protein